MLSRIYTADVPVEHVVNIDFVLDSITRFDRIWSNPQKWTTQVNHFTINILLVIFEHKIIFGQHKYGQPCFVTFLEFLNIVRFLLLFNILLKVRFL